MQDVFQSAQVLRWNIGKVHKKKKWTLVLKEITHLIGRVRNIVSSALTKCPQRDALRLKHKASSWYFLI